MTTNTDTTNTVDTKSATKKVAKAAKVAKATEKAAEKPAKDKATESTKTAKGPAKAAEKPAKATEVKPTKIFNDEFLRAIGEVLGNNCGVTEEGYTTCATQIVVDDLFGNLEGKAIYHRDFTNALRGVVDRILEANEAPTLERVMADKVWKNYDIQIDQLRMIVGYAVHHTKGIYTAQRVGIRKGSSTNPVPQPSVSVLKVLISVAGRLGVVKGFSYSVGRGMGFYPSSVDKAA